MPKFRHLFHVVVAHVTCFAAIVLVAFSASIQAQTFSLDSTFTAGVRDAADRCYVSVVQPDGKILVGGYFEFVNGVPLRGVARLNSDGSRDTGFNPGGVGVNGNGGVEDIVVLNNGKILIGGYFTGYNGMPAVDLARLNADGTFDPTFNSGGSGVSGYYVASLAVQPDGKIIAAGSGITGYNGSSNFGIFRLNADGSLDNSFVSGFPEVQINQIALQPDGKIVVAKGNGIARMNADGSLDGQFITATGFNTIEAINSVGLQNDGKILFAGGFVAFNEVPRAGLARLNADGTLDMKFAPPPTLYAKFIFPLSNGQFLVAGFNESTSGYGKALVRLNQDGSVDTEFGGLSDNTAEHITMQPDGKILLSGSFGQVAPGHDTIGIARYDAAGNVDQSFSSSLTTYAAITAMKPQADGKIIVAGDFTTANGQHANKLARFNTDGTLDGSFQVGLGPLHNSYTRLNAIAIQNDGRILVGGNFVGFNGTDRRNVARLNSDGSVDTSFNMTELTFDFVDGVKDVVVQPDGKVLVCGFIMRLTNGGAYKFIVRLNSDGSLDPAFSLDGLPNLSFPRGYRMLLQPDGKIVVAGLYYSSGPANRRTIARFNADGTLDDSFARPIDSAQGVPALISLALQNDGKVVKAGYQSFGPMNFQYVRRVNLDGTADTGFNGGVTGFNITPKTLLLQTNGKILAGGAFTNIGGVPHDRLARINADGTLDASFVSGTFSVINNFYSGVTSLVFDTNGRLYVGGGFTAYDGFPRNGLLRLVSGTTAASASISGRVMTANGQGIRNAKVVVTGNSLAQPRIAQTGSFGWFSFDGLQTGETYVVTVNSRRYTFSAPSRVISLVDNVIDADFIADPQE